MSGNFTVLLWQKFFEDLARKFQIPKEAALPYLQKTFENLKVLPERALTGPIGRKDFTTLKANLHALQGDPMEKIYQSFLDVYVPEFDSEVSL